MKENITRRVVQCPNCYEYHNDIDRSGYCESCWPATQYARGAGQKILDDFPIEQDGDTNDL